MSDHRSVSGIDGGLEFLRSMNGMFKGLQEGKNQIDQKLGVLEAQTKRQELFIKACESELKLIRSQLGLRDSEIRSHQETLHANQERMNTFVERVEKELADLQSTSASRQFLQSEPSYQRFMELRLYELEREGFGATEEHDKRSRHELVHGGCVRADIQAIERASITDILRYLRVLEGFQNCYGITVDHFKEAFQGAPPEVLDALDKRRNLKKIKFWQDDKNIQTRDILVSIANEIIEKWETRFHDTLDVLYRKLTQQYDDRMRNA